MILIGGGGELFEYKYADPEKKLTLNNLSSKYFVLIGDKSTIFFPFFF